MIQSPAFGARVPGFTFQLQHITTLYLTILHFSFLFHNMGLNSTQLRCEIK